MYTFIIKNANKAFLFDRKCVKLQPFLVMNEASVMQRIGFVGLGAMGSVMAPLPTRAGFSVIGFDSAAQRLEITDVEHALTLADLTTCDSVITMLPDGTEVTAVATKLANAGFRGLIIDMSSSHPADTTRLGKVLAAQGIRLIDAPVSGGVKKQRVARSWLWQAERRMISPRPAHCLFVLAQCNMLAH